MKTTIQSRKPVVLLLAAALLWSSGGLVIKAVQMSVLTTAGLRSCAAAAFLLFFVHRRNFTFSIPQVIGAIAACGSILLFVAATRMTTAANAILLQYTSPIYVAILGLVFLNEKVSRSQLVTMMVMAIGMFLFFFDKLSPGQLTGNIFALLSAVCIAVLAVCLRKQAAGSPLETVFLGNVLTALLCSGALFGNDIRPTDLLIISVAGMFQLALPFVLYSAAIRSLKALDANLVLSIEPILNPIWVFLAMGEHPQAWALAGGALVIGAVTFRYIR